MKKLIPFLCAFMYFMSPYRLAGHEMPEVIGLFAIALAFGAGYKCDFDKYYIRYFVYMWLIPPMAGLFVGVNGSYFQAFIPVAMIITSLYIGYLVPNVDKNSVLRYYRILVYIAVAFFVIQEISFISFGYRPTLFLSFFEMYYEGSDAASFSSSRAAMERSSSFFLEPSHLVQYIIPYYCIILSKYLSAKKGCKEVLFMTFIIFTIRSGVGFIALISIVSFFFLKSNALKFYQKILIVSVGFVLLLMATTVFSNNPFVASILSRSSEFSTEVEAYGSQSGFIRIWRGYFIYASMDIINQIFGVSIAGVDAITKAVFIPGCRFEGTFSNGIQALLIYGGIIGFLLFMSYIIKLYKKCDITGKVIIVSMITIFFMEHMLNTPKMFLYILLASCFMRKINIKTGKKIDLH